MHTKRRLWLRRKTLPKSRPFPLKAPISKAAKKRHFQRLSCCIILHKELLSRYDHIISTRGNSLLSLGFIKELL